MRLRLEYRRSSGIASDLAVTVDQDTAVGTLARALVRRDPRAEGPDGPVTIACHDAGGATRTLSGAVALGESGLRSGSTISVVPDSSGPARLGGAAVLTVHSGPDAGRSFDLAVGVNTLGRRHDCAVQLTDPLVSGAHARVLVGDVIEIVDDNSANGLIVDGEVVSRLVLRPGDRVLLGDSVVSIAPTGSVPIGTTALTSTIAFNRSPRVDPTFEGETFTAPEPPQPQKAQRFPLAMVAMPFLMGAVFFGVTAATNKSGGAAAYASVVFVALSPLMMVGAWFENRRANRLDWEEAIAHFRSNLAELVVELHRAIDIERASRCIEHPATAETVGAAMSLGPLLWTRRPEHERFLHLRLGLGTLPSRNEIQTEGKRQSVPEVAAEVTEVVTRFAFVDGVPVVGSFAESGSIGVSGPDDARLGMARALVAQLVGLHSPAEVVLCGVASPRSAAQWEWLKWLPHTGSDHAPFTSDPLASTGPACANLVAELFDLVGERSSEDDRTEDGAPTLPAVVVVVEDDAPVERARLVRLAEMGPAHGVHLIWVAATTPALPAVCRTYVELEPTTGRPSSGNVVQASITTPIQPELLDAATATAFARRLSAVVDAGALVDDASDVPARVSFVTEAGAAVMEDPNAVVERWTESNSLPGLGPSRRSRRDNTLRAFVGRTATAPLHLDLRTQGPHALVGGTTGAGKSEFLQTWILGMAASHSPQRVTFLFVDYKGGSAFADCVALPHCVGLVTDLSPRLVQRALASLNAELRHREHVLNRKKAKDLLELERRGDPEAPPSLVIVVDEFAALVQEVPEFVDGVVNVAQRGRSLGLHLILATQRPAGVIKDNLRANTNLRIALRMADEDDSLDVVGTSVAASFDPELPGRAIVKAGPGRTTLFQSGYVGGWTSNQPPEPVISIAALGFGVSIPWSEPDAAESAEPERDPGAPDIQRIVANVSAASAGLELPRPRRPWLPELAAAYDLATLPLPRRDSELVLGVADHPDRQVQEVVAFRPDQDGNMAVFGTGGSGKSTLLRTLAVSAGFRRHGGPCFVYALDYGSRGLSMLETLPHVGSVIGADDVERTERLLVQLRDTVDERAVRYAAVNAATIDEYRRAADQPDEPRVLLLIDGFAAFRTAYETGPNARLLDLLIGIAGDGRPVGVHLVLTADRVGAVPSTLASAIQRRVALRLANDMDESMLDVPRGGFADDAPPGRGYLDGVEVQIAVLGGSADASQQASAMQRFAESMRRAGALEAPAIRRLPEVVRLDELPPTIDGAPAFALSDETLGPVGLLLAGTFLVAGPPRSGRTTAVRTLVASLRRARPDLRFAWLGPTRSPLAADSWDRAAAGADAVGALAGELRDLIADHPGPPEWVVVIDGLGELATSEADWPLQELLKACRSADLLVIAEGETADLSAYSEIIRLVKASATGIVLQPDQSDGDALFRTTFGRMNRAEFPVGRGMLVRSGRAVRVQVALPG